MKRILPLCALTLLCLISCLSFSQMRFQRTFGEANDENAYTVEPLADGGYLLCGFTLSYGLTYSDYLVVRTAPNGDTLWTKLYGGSGEEVSYTAQQTFDGGFIIGGYTDSYGAGLWDVFLVKTDGSGNVQWSKTYGGSGYETASLIRQLPDSGFIVTGYTNSYGNGAYDGYLLRTDAGGNLLWSKTYGGGNWDWINVVEQTSDGNLILCGTSMSYGQGNMEAWLLKTDLNGDTLWTRTYGKSGADDAYTLLQLPDSGFVISGITNSAGAGGADAFVIRTDQNGDTLWCKTYGGNGDDRAYWSTLTKDGDMAIVGLTQSFGAGLSDLYMLKLDLNGDTLFTKTMGGAQDDWGNHIVELPWGDFAISGINASSGAGGNDMYFLLTSPLGLSGGCTEYNTGTEINNAPFVINSNAAVIDSGGQVNTPSAASVSHGAQVNVLCSQCDSAVAQFTYTDSSNTVQFSDASSGASTWFWDFGDGNNSTLQNPSHTYAADSTYFVCLIISNNCSVDTICDSVVICTLPIAAFSWMQDTVLSIQFSDSSTGANSWYWDFGDGDTSTLQNPNHIYGAEGWYLVCLYVSDGFCSDSICDSIFVSGNSVEELNGTFDLLISPNPSDGRFELLFHSRESHKFNALIYQVDGRLVDYRQLNFQNGLNSQKYFLQNLSPGMYILDLNDGVQRMRKKLIIR